MGANRIKISQSTITKLCIFSLLFISIIVTIFWAFPNLFPDISLQYFVLPLSISSGLLGVYKYFKGYSPEELVKLLKKAELMQQIRNHETESLEYKNTEERIQEIVTLKKQITQFLDCLIDES